MIVFASATRAGVGRTGGLAALLAVSVAVALLGVGDAGDVAVGSLIMAAFVSPGVMAVARLAEPGRRWLVAVTIGPALGLAASNLALLALWAAGGRGSWLFAAAPLGAGLLGLWAPRLRGRWNLPSPRVGDANALLALLLLVPLLVGPPFARVGEPTPNGIAYRQYFTADYVWRRAVVAELSKGDFLPKNPYYIDDALHYYWLPHLLSAVEHRVRPSVGLDVLLLGRTVLVDLVFVAGLFGIARTAVALPWAAAAGVACGILVTSGEALVAAWNLWRQGLPVEWMRYLNIDAISRWHFDGMPIDGLQRVLWYQPHHALGYLLGLLGVLAVARRVRPRDPAVFAVAGSLLAMSTLVSSFAGLMFTVIAATYEAVRTMARREWRPAFFNAAYAALPLALGAALVTALHYIDQPPDDNLSVIRLGLNPIAVQRFWLVTAMSFGPAVLLALPGLFSAGRQRLAEFRPFAVVLPVAWAFYFFVDIRDHQNVYVGWRVGHLTFLALIPFAAMSLVVVAGARGTVRRLCQAAIVAALILGLPTSAVDTFNTQDIQTQVPEPGFNHTEFLTPGEVEALGWLRTHTADGAIVQVDAEARGSDMWAFIPAFAERRMAAGLPLSMVPLRKYVNGAHRIHWLYHVDSAASAFELANRYGIDYLVVGAPERRANPGVERRWHDVPALFAEVFKNGSLTIFAVRHPRGTFGRPAPE